MDDRYEHDDPDDRLQLLRLLLADRDWRCEPRVRQLLRGFLEEPQAAQEAAWRALAEELADYLAFRKLADLLARGCGCPRARFRFTRSDWEAHLLRGEAGFANGLAVRPRAHALAPPPSPGGGGSR